jgi:hypothetical protein
VTTLHPPSIKVGCDQNREPAPSIARMPIVLRLKEITANAFSLTFARPANIVTPISSGSGEAITNPAIPADT